MKSQIVIPARLKSTRLPEKLLLAETGKPLIQHTYESAQRASRPNGICVAADHPRIAEAVRGFGGTVVMTNPAAASGTDRVAEVAGGMADTEIIVNVQGDEPEISAAAIDLVVQLLEENPAVKMSTLATPIRDRDQLEDPACVKVVCDDRGRALYFSRSVVPHPREWKDTLLAQDPPAFCQHLGIYAYQREFLLQLAEMPRSTPEQLENLEQLRVLSAGETILVGFVEEPSIGIDTEEDYRRFVRKFTSG